MGEASGLEGLIQAAFAPVVALALCMARPMGAALVLPVFTRASLGVPLRAGFAAAVALPAVAPTLVALREAMPEAMKGGALWLGLIAMKEMLAGVLVGLLFGLPIWAAQSAGEVLDTQRGASGAGVGDPGAGGQMSSTAGLLATTGTAMFVMAGGLGFLAAAIYASYGLWPLVRLAPRFAPDTPGLLLAALDGVVRTGLLVAAPVVLAMLLADTVVALVARSAPKLGMFDLAATLRNLVFLAMMALYLAFLLDYLAAQAGEAARVGERLRALLR